MGIATLVLGAALNPGGLIAWLVIGLISGALADWVIPGKGFGLIGNLVVGLIGAFIGGLLINLLVPDATYAFWGSLIVAFLGACVIFLLVNAFRGRRGSTL
jgi:uncharacterized membrane protein YeaQ/YmgE (transglycosylase-associated protein family)